MVWICVFSHPLNPLPNFHVEVLSRMMVWGGGVFGKCLCPGVKPSLMGLVSYRRGPRRTPSSFFHHVRTQWKYATWEPGRGPAVTRTSLCWHLDLGLSTSRTRRKFMMFISHSVLFSYSIQNGLIQSDLLWKKGKVQNVLNVNFVNFLTSIFSL